MPPSLELLKTKFTSLLAVISSGLDSKLEKTDAAVSAYKLTNPFTLSFTGDATGSKPVAGNANVAVALTLANTAVSPGTYPKVTVDAKGRVIAAELLIGADIPSLDAAKIGTGIFSALRIPNLDASKINAGAFDPARIPGLDASKTTTGVFAVERIPTLNQDTTGKAATATSLAVSRTLSMTGDGSWDVSFNGSADASATFTLANSGVVAGTYGSETAIPRFVVDAKGRITSIETVAIKAGTAIPVKEYRDIDAGASAEYDLQTLLGAAAVNYDLSTAEIAVRVRDTNAASPTYNAYINPEAVVTYGLRDERYVVIANQFDTAMNFHVKVLVHPTTV